MKKVLTAEQMREVDRLTTERYGIPSILLMENAAHAVARVITEKLGGSVKGKSILILCGKGNNGGDGAALARILWKDGAFVTPLLFGQVNQIDGDARTNLDTLLAIEDEVVTSGGEFNKMLLHCDDEDLVPLTEWFLNMTGPKIVVDALFGTGLKRPLVGVFVDAIERVENHRPDVVSVDIPSGLDADQGAPIGPCVSADVTVTFTAPKPANVIPPASTFNGNLIVANIGSPQALIDEQPSNLFVGEQVDVEHWLRKSQFSSGSYKNKRGHTLIVAGSDDYSGAAVMCGNSAMRSGVGLTTLLVPASCKVEVASRVIPEVIVGTIGDNTDAIRKADSILIGPGLDANDARIEKLVREIVLTRRVPVVLDAGALWFCNPEGGLLRDGSPPYEGGVAPASGDGVVLSSRSESTSVEPSLENHPVAEAAPPLLRKEGSRERHPPLILTPHEGEFLRLLGTEDKNAIKDRVAAVRAFAVENNVILVLKGERVLIGSPDGRVVVNPTGNAGLGKAGNGDTLAGILAGFTAQAVKFEIDIFETVVAAVYVAGMAGDVAEKKYGKRVMTASDVRECLTDVFDSFGKKDS